MPSKHLRTAETGVADYLVVAVADFDDAAEACTAVDCAVPVDAAPAGYLDRKLLLLQTLLASSVREVVERGDEERLTDHWSVGGVQGPKLLEELLLQPLVEEYLKGNLCWGVAVVHSLVEKVNAASKTAELQLELQLLNSEVGETGGVEVDEDTAEWPDWHVPWLRCARLTDEDLKV